MLGGGWIAHLLVVCGVFLPLTHLPRLSPLPFSLFYVRSESDDCFVEDQAFSPSYDVAPPVSKLDRRHTGRPGRRENLLTVKGEERDREGAESYDHKKAWSYMNHSILSVTE